MSSKLDVAIAESKNLTVASDRLLVLEFHEVLGKKDAGTASTPVPSLGADFAPSGRGRGKLSERMLAF